MYQSFVVDFKLPPIPATLDEPGKANGRGEEPAIAAAYVASGVP